MNAKSLVLILTVGVFLVGCGHSTQPDTPRTSTATTPDVPTTQASGLQPELMKQTRLVKLYFADTTRFGLAVETRKLFDIPDRPSMILQVLSTLERGPLGKLSPTVPATLTVNNVFVDGNTIFVNLKREKNHAQIGGIEGESLLINSIANTALAIYPEYKAVRFLVDGGETDTLLGHIDARQSFTFNRNIIVRH